MSVERERRFLLPWGNSRSLGSLGLWQKEGAKETEHGAGSAA